MGVMVLFARSLPASQEFLLRLFSVIVDELFVEYCALATLTQQHCDAFLGR